MTILVVEDEALIRLSLVDALQEQSFETVEAADADEALEILRTREDITLMVTDIDMPNGSMNGLSLSRCVQEKWPPIRIFIMSGFRRLVAHEIPSGARFFSKPFSFDEMINAARSIN